jgi:glycogen operon protein
MLLAGDEIGHTQLGNNNAYCQDNSVCWLDWQRADGQLAGFTRQLIALRRRYSALRHASWYSGTPQADGQPDITWLGVDRSALDDAAWNSGERRVGIRMSAQAGAADGNAICLLLVNAQPQAVAFTLPAGTWQISLNSALPAQAPDAISGHIDVPAHALVLLVMNPLGHLTTTMEAL